MGVTNPGDAAQRAETPARGAASYAEHVAQVRAAVREIAASEAAALTGAVALDVREPDETATGTLPGAQLVPRGFLEQRVAAAVPDPATPIVVYCAAGNRSILAARTLAELGYRDVRSLAGGIAAWRAAGLPIEQAAAGLSAAQRARYARHLILPEVGEAGQLRLLAARIALIGAGGLGSPAALYLAAAGAGTLTLFDDDAVDVSNLQRQVIHTTERVGQPKVDSAARTIAALNPDVAVVGHRLRLTSERALELLAGHDVIVDGSDNFTTRYLVNDVALRLGIPVVHASVWRFEGQLSVFAAGGRPCYRCLYPEPPPPGASPSCAEAGVLGVLPGVMGVLQATEAIKLVLGLPSIAGRLLVYDAVRTKLRDLALRADPRCATCGEGVDRSAIPLIDYAAFCAGT